MIAIACIAIITIQTRLGLDTLNVLPKQLLKVYVFFVNVTTSV